MIELNRIYSDISKIRSLIDKEYYGPLFMQGQKSTIKQCEAPLQYLDSRIWVISIAYTIIFNHIFNDGNKRTAAILILFYYNINKSLLFNLISTALVENYSREEFIKEVISNVCIK